MAFRAGPSSIVRMVTRQGVKLGLLGLLVGAPGVLLVSRVIANLLVYAPPIDTTTILAVFVILFLSTLAASWIPARRAASLDPVIVLRE